MSQSSQLTVVLGVATVAVFAAALTVIRPADAGGLGCTVNALGSSADREICGRTLRGRGPEGLSEALALFEATNVAGGFGNAGAEAVERAKQLVDQVAGQRDAWMSRLYWYTDLEQAKAAAAASDKPILSLRMLGNLTDEFSCANSRFFRTALYANESVSRRLRDHFVLHWASVRPVPRVTIDFGDGRKLERTVTGNSAHYVLDATGRPLDVLPGLYGPVAFERWLGRCEALANDVGAAGDDAQRSAVLTSYHAARRDAIDAELQADLVGSEVHGATVTPLVASSPELVRVEELKDDAWQRIAALAKHHIALDDHSLTLMRRDHPDAAAAGLRALSKTRVEDPLVRMLTAFTKSVALDTVKNEYLLHRQIHQWFIDGSAPRDFDALNERVYAELFLTPSSDPWLGLAPPDAYTGLLRGGRSTPGVELTQLESAR